MSAVRVVPAAALAAAQDSTLLDRALAALLEQPSAHLTISAFPGVGKSHFFRAARAASFPDLLVRDSDSSQHKENWPVGYLDHLTASLPATHSITLVSSHAEVLAGLHERGIDCYVVYPRQEDKAVYMKRYRERGSPEAFVTLMDERWDAFHEHLRSQQFARGVETREGEYLSDVMPRIIADYLRQCS